MKERVFSLCIILIEKKKGFVNMATSSFSKSFILDGNKMSKECKNELFGDCSAKTISYRKSHIADSEEIKKILSNLKK